MTTGKRANLRCSFDDFAGQEIADKLFTKKMSLELVKQILGNSGRTIICLDASCERNIDRHQSVTEKLSEYLQNNKIQERINHHLIHVKANRATLDIIFSFTNHILSTDISGILGEEDHELAEWIKSFMNRKNDRNLVRKRRRV